MTDAKAPPEPLPRWLPWAFVALLALPFCPFWVDFEQVRRALLLVLAGAALLLLPRLGPAVGERAGWWFVGLLAASAAVNFAGQAVAATDGAPISFQPWEAVQRLAHWLALGVVLRLGARAPAGFAEPIAAALLVTSLYGLLQQLGLAAIGGYGMPSAPVSVFGNLNVAAEWTAVAAAAVAVQRPKPAWLWASALVLASAYLVANGSRSGLVALPLGLGLCWLLRRGASTWRPLAFAGAGALLGLLAVAAGPRSELIDAAAAKAEADRALGTLTVRLEIAKGSSRLFAEAPLFGHGPGQFQVQYPRVRSQAEIEISSHGRRFASEVRTAHDDWLELLVDGGLPALALFAWVLFALQRGSPDRARLVPLFVLLLVMLARSPLWNAPAAAVALLLVGRPAPPPRARAWHRTARTLLALALVALGAVVLAAHTFVVPYHAARARGDQPPITALERAAAVMPWEPRWPHLLAQEQAFAGDLAAATATAATAHRLRPFEPQLAVLRGELLARQHRLADAAIVARHALAIDPPNPELRVLLGTVLARDGEHEVAVETLVDDPHPRLRELLGTTFRSLADLAQRAGDAAGHARFRLEQHFVQAIDALGDRSTAGLAATGGHVEQIWRAAQDAGRLGSDSRPHLVSALHALELGDLNTAIQLGQQVQQRPGTLEPWQLTLVGDKLAPLRNVESWQPVLAP